MPNKQEIEAVILLDADKRYEYSVKRIADEEALWVIGDNGGLRTYGDNDENIIFPIWPSGEFAFLCCTEEYENCKPEKIIVNKFIDDYLPDLKDKGCKLSIFPLSTNKGSIVDIDEFRESLLEELKKYD